MDPIHRFSSRVEDYVRYRPSYPAGLTGLLARECGLSAESRVADIGSGTGLLSALFLNFGCEVLGVEPNPGMRLAAGRMLTVRPRFRSIDGRAEATTLADASVDFVTAGQAFHWFEPEPTRAEFRRILRPDGWVVLVWNERVDAPGFMAAYDQLVARYGPERPRLTAAELARFFDGAPWRMTTLPNRQDLDLEGLQGRFLSSSYAPLPGTPLYGPLLGELRSLFDQHQHGDIVTLQYETEIYTGRLL